MRTVLFISFLVLGLNVFSQDYKIGEKIEVQIEDVWFDAYIMEIDDKKIKLNYDGVSDENDFWVKEKDIRKKQTKKDGKVVIDMSMGSQKPDDPKNEEDEDNSISVKTVVITLHNTCSRKEEFVLDDVLYEVDAYKKKKVEVPLGTLIYSMDLDKKVIKGKVTPALTVFHPNCE